eukprot:4770096-Pyramimonas_sp.AAC.1
MVQGVESAWRRRAPWAPGGPAQEVVPIQAAVGPVEAPAHVGPCSRWAEVIDERGCIQKERLGQITQDFHDLPFAQKEELKRQADAENARNRIARTFADPLLRYQDPAADAPVDGPAPS